MGATLGSTAFWGVDFLYWQSQGELQDKSLLGPSYGVAFLFGFQAMSLRPFARLGYTAMRVLESTTDEPEYAHGAFGGFGLDFVLMKNLWLGLSWEWRANLAWRSHMLPAGTIGSACIKLVI